MLLDNLDPHNPTNIFAQVTYAYDVTLPSVTCESCTLQIIQVMTDAPGIHAPYDPNAPDADDIYYQCIDLVLEGEPVDDGAPSNGGAGGSGGSGTIDPDGVGGAGGEPEAAAGAGGSDTRTRGAKSGDDGGCSLAPSRPLGSSAATLATLGALVAAGARPRRPR